MTRRDDLLLARTALLGALDDPNEPTASIVRELRAVVRELDEIGEPVEEVSVADQLASKRQARLAVPDDSAPAARRGQPRRSGRVHPAS